MENIIIVGAGPAGISAALYAARGNMDPLIINTGIGIYYKFIRNKDAEIEVVQNEHVKRVLLGENRQCKFGLITPVESYWRN